MCSDEEICHPLFARLVARTAGREGDELRAHRQRLLAGLSGIVVEVGAGAGANFAYYPPAVDAVVAIEPEPHLRSVARVAAVSAPVKVTVVDATADCLPLKTGSCDAVVACLVLCSVPQQATALSEARRVLRDGGQLRYYEHVSAGTTILSTLQRGLDRTLWPRLFGGCRTARDTSRAIADAGFRVEQEQRLRVGTRPLDIPAAPRILGTARR